jgi:hypothetical protein
MVPGPAAPLPRRTYASRPNLVQLRGQANGSRGGRRFVLFEAGHALAGLVHFGAVGFAHLAALADHGAVLCHLLRARGQLRGVGLLLGRGRFKLRRQRALVRRQLLDEGGLGRRLLRQQLPLAVLGRQRLDQQRLPALASRQLRLQLLVPAGAGGPVSDVRPEQTGGQKAREKKPQTGPERPHWACVASTEAMTWV